MPFPRPTLSQLRVSAGADLAAALPGADSLLRFSNLRVLTDVEAAAVNGLYGYLDWIARMAIPFTCADEFLDGWAGLKGITRKPATGSIGVVQLTGSSGVVIPAGAAFTRSDGVAFVSTAEAAVNAGTGFAQVPIASVATGSNTNGDVGTGMTLGVAIAGVAAAGSVSTALTGGSDVELDADFRSRMLAAYASPPQGGAAADYIEWAKEVPGVTRAWVNANGMGAGTVVVFIMLDVAQASNGGFPQGTDGVAADEPRDTSATGDQLAVADAIFPKQPVTALVYAVGPQANTAAFTIAGISGATTAVKAAISDAIDAAFLAHGEPGGAVELSYIEGAIAAIPGSAGFVITLIACNHGSVAPGASGNITSDPGYLPVRGVITWAA